MDQVLELLSRDFGGGWTPLRIGQVLLVVAGLWWLARRFVFPPKPRQMVGMREARCGCGWGGQTSAHAPRCPRCGKPAVLV